MSRARAIANEVPVTNGPRFVDDLLLDSPPEPQPLQTQKPAPVPVPVPVLVPARPDENEILIIGLPRTTAAMIVMFLVALDGWTTLVWIDHGWGYELNPAMAWLTSIGGDTLFITAKLLLSGLCMLWVVRRAPLLHARIATCCAFAIYGGVVMVHIYNAMHLGGDLVGVPVS